MPIFQFIYTSLSSLLLLCALPLILVVAVKAKYRTRIFRRLGLGLKAQMRRSPKRHSKQFTIWIHALSVGEVTSALPLVRGLRQQFPASLLIFSATTRSGGEVAEALLAPLVDAIIPAPLDFGPVVPYYLQCIRPDLFIQVETDFWPHWLFCLRRSKIPMMLVNGRISARSFSRYRRFPLLFRRMFAAFDLLAMQTENDAGKMRQLGLAAEKVLTLGNLKLDIRLEKTLDAISKTVADLREEYGFSRTDPLWICGSTHPGEEKVLFRIFSQLQAQFPGIQLLLAPRNIERAGEVLSLGEQLHLPCRCRTKDPQTRGPVLLLDTIGELAGCYAMADIAFVGGSLVEAGGHNPLEPASYGVPVLVGPHTEDFSEITKELAEAGGLIQAKTGEELTAHLLHLLADPIARAAMGNQAAIWVDAHRGVVTSHLKVIERLLNDPPSAR